MDAKPRFRVKAPSQRTSLVLISDRAGSSEAVIAEQVGMLDRLMEEVKSGNVKSLALVAVHQDGNFRSGFMSNGADRALRGAVAWLAYRMDKNFEES